MRGRAGICNASHIKQPVDLEGKKQDMALKAIENKMLLKYVSLTFVIFKSANFEIGTPALLAEIFAIKAPGPKMSVGSPACCTQHEIQSQRTSWNQHLNGLYVYATKKKAKLGLESIPQYFAINNEDITIQVILQ